MNDSHIKRFAASFARSSPRGATEMAYMLMAGSFDSHAFAMTGNALLRSLSWASTFLTIAISPPMCSLLSRSFPPKISLSLACRNRTHPIAIEAAMRALGILGKCLSFPATVHSKMLLVVRWGARLAANATYLAERVSSSRCFCTHS